MFGSTQYQCVVNHHFPAVVIRFVVVVLKERESGMGLNISVTTNTLSSCFLASCSSAHHGQMLLH